MKKYLFIAAAATLAACSNETLVETPQVPEEKEVAIDFGTDMANMTRAENSSGETKYALSNYHNTFFVWGYKRVELSDTEHTYITVFNGINDVVNGEKHSLVTWDDPNWTYSPARFWDKSATHYNFYAAAPSQYQWIATVDNLEDMDDEDDVKFSLNDFTTDGLSLAQNAEKPTPSETSLFAEDTETNPDLMISNDITVHKTYTTEKVNFEFNHLLSRLNIAVRKDASVTGVVKIKELKVYNLKDKGNFAEAFGTTGLTAETLKEGTDLRWTPSYKNNQSVVGIAFKNESTAAAPTTEVDAVEGPDYIGGSTTSTATNIVGKDFNFFYQGLVIPQTAKYVACEMNGIDVYDHTKGLAKATTTAPFIKINYTIDGEPFVYYYNLAEVFSNVNAQYNKNIGTTTYYAFKTAGGGYLWEDEGTYYVETAPNNMEKCTSYALFDGAKYYDPADNSEIFLNTADGKFYKEDTFENLSEVQDPTFLLCDDTDTHSLLPLLRKELDPALGECDVTFNEGWQNNLWITIKPTTIQFAAEVYEWATKEDNNHTIE